jgi:hypothetical protein
MLSERGQKYLASLTRDREWTSEKGATEEYFVKNGIVDYAALLHFQMSYSGYTLAKRRNSVDSFTAQLLSRKQINSRKSLDFFEVENTLLFDCGVHRTAQFGFYLTQKGQLCTLGDADDINIISESFDREVDRYAMCNQIADWAEHPYYCSLDDSSQFDKLISAFKSIEECSDQYCSWWTNDELIVIKGTWLDSKAFFIHFYGRSKNLVNEFLERITKEEIIKLKRDK